MATLRLVGALALLVHMKTTYANTNKHDPVSVFARHSTVCATTTRLANSHDGLHRAEREFQMQSPLSGAAASFLVDVMGVRGRKNSVRPSSQRLCSSTPASP